MSLTWSDVCTNDDLSKQAHTHRVIRYVIFAISSYSNAKKQTNNRTEREAKNKRIIWKWDLNHNRVTIWLHCCYRFFTEFSLALSPFCVIFDLLYFIFVRYFYNVVDFFSRFALLRCSVLIHIWPWIFIEHRAGELRQCDNRDLRKFKINKFSGVCFAFLRHRVI